MPVSVVGKRSGRPDYSFTSTFGITPPMPSGIYTIYFSDQDDIPAGYERIYVPVDWNARTFPREGRSLRVRTFIVSGDADTLLWAVLIHVPRKFWDAYHRGEISLDDMLNNSVYFYRDISYQRIYSDILFYPINYPDVLLYTIYNPSEQTRRVAVTLKMEEHPLYGGEVGIAVSE